MRGQPRQQRAEHAAAGLGVGQRAVALGDLDAQRLGQRHEPPLAHERREPAGERDGAQRRRIRPRQALALAGLAQDAAVEARVVGDEHAPVQRGDEIGEDDLGLRRLVDHRLRDAGEPLDPARQRRADRAQRGEAVVQLTAAHEDRPDLGDLAGIAAQAVGLGVDGQELGGAQRKGEEVHDVCPTPWPRRSECDLALLSTSRRGSIAKTGADQLEGGHHAHIRRRPRAGPPGGRA
ncbi:MAG: hypothetical protein U0S48_05950 [Solirubrobacteraceae bacterium]